MYVYVIYQKTITKYGESKGLHMGHVSVFYLMW